MQPAIQEPQQGQMMLRNARVLVSDLAETFQRNALKSSSAKLAVHGLQNLAACS